jgi:hypothetical protein
VDDALTLLAPPPHAEVLGPVPVGEESRVIVRVPRAEAAALSLALQELQRVRSARKLDAVCCWACVAVDSTANSIVLHTTLTASPSGPGPSRDRR